MQAVLSIFVCAAIEEKNTDVNVEIQDMNGINRMWLDAEYAQLIT